ncbi:MAG: metallophosphoesterase [Natronincolaceae bacterium]|jgi:predicted MPP superfamily phosphohydrolase|nr:metallophosphoesterase [Bacillota bacterium]
MKVGPKTIKTILALAFIGITVFFIYQNNALVVTNYNYKNPKLPEGFHGYRIAQVSDLHNKNFHGRLTEKIKAAKPDIVVITGDLIDSRNTKIDTATDFVQEAVKIAPIYYVSGNHEQSSDKYDLLKGELEKLNVQIIDNYYMVLSRNGDKIGLMGVADPAIKQNEKSYPWLDSNRYIENNLEKLFNHANTDFNILLSHRPEQFGVYKDMNVDLVFSGHAHGGQIRIPFIGGMFAPGQGLFPKYTNGIHRDGGTSMVVSRGLGNSVFPFRIFNRPELVVVTFYPTPSKQGDGSSV